MRNSSTIKASDGESALRIYDFLTSQPVGVLATVDPNSNPHAAAVYFFVDDDFTITFATKQNTKKNDNLKHRNHVMLIAFDTESQTTAQITGVAEDISETSTGQETFTKMLVAAEATSESGVPPISKLIAGQYTAWRIRPKQIRMAIFARPDPGGYDIYETIDF